MHISSSYIIISYPILKTSLGHNCSCNSVLEGQLGKTAKTLTLTPNNRNAVADESWVITLMNLNIFVWQPGKHNGSVCETFSHVLDHLDVISSNIDNMLPTKVDWLVFYNKKTTQSW